jgi:hypothetical protein
VRTKFTTYLLGALVGGAGLTALATGSASASSIVFVKNYNVYEVSPSAAATLQRQLSANGAQTGAYLSPTEADNGVVVAVYETNTDGMFISWNADGSYRGAATTDPGGGVGNSVPLSADVDPGDGMIGYGYMYFGGPADSYNTYPQVDVQNPNTAYVSGQYPSYQGYLSPRYVFSTGTYGMIPDGTPQIDVQQPPNGPMPWITLPSGYNVDSFDESRTSPRRVLVEYDNGTTHSVALYQEDATPPGPATQLCSGYPLSAPSVGNSLPRWSPDGTQIVWSDAQGVEISAAPVNDNGTCALSPKLLVAGGAQADWGPAEIGTGSGGGGTGSAGGGGAGSGGGGAHNRCTVPRLVGSTLHRAKQLLSRAHCSLGTVTKRKSLKRRRGRVLAQARRQGRVLPYGSRVNVTVGR